LGSLGKKIITIHILELVLFVNIQERVKVFRKQKIPSPTIPRRGRKEDKIRNCEPTPELHQTKKSNIFSVQP
jgi:hypothetical protein